MSFKEERKKISFSVIVGAAKLIDVKQKPFLDNETNKQRFISLLSNFMKDSGINVRHAAAEADVLIVNVALE